MIQYKIVKNKVILPIEERINIKKGITKNKPYIERKEIESFNILDDVNNKLTCLRTHVIFNNEINEFTIIEYSLEEYDDNNYIKTCDYSEMVLKVKDRFNNTIAIFNTFEEAYQLSLQDSLSFIDCDNLTIVTPIES